MESDKDRYIQTLSFHELKQIKMYSTDIEQRKELKKNKIKLTKFFTIIKQRLQLDFIKLCN
jgi:hypothetical protein